MNVAVDYDSRASPATHTRTMFVNARAGGYTGTMRGGRKAAAIVVAFAVLTGVLGACSSDDDSQARAKRQQRSAQQKAVAAKRAKQVAQRRRVARFEAWARRRARAEAERERERQARLLRIRRARAAGSPARDRAAIQRSVRQLNAAFDKGVMRGVARSVALNYWVGAGVYDAAACVAFEVDGGERVVAETLLIRSDTFRSTPGWVDPDVGRVPSGRLYEVTVDHVQTLVPTGEQRTAVRELHATVLGDGRARLFFRCA
jgi:hypothetical protein